MGVADSCVVISGKSSSYRGVLLRHIKAVLGVVIAGAALAAATSANGKPFPVIDVIAGAPSPATNAAYSINTESRSVAVPFTVMNTGLNTINRVYVTFSAAAGITQPTAGTAGTQRLLEVSTCVSTSPCATPTSVTPAAITESTTAITYFFDILGPGAKFDVTVVFQTPFISSPYMTVFGSSSFSSNSFPPSPQLIDMASVNITFGTDPSNVETYVLRGGNKVTAQETGKRATSVQIPGNIVSAAAQVIQGTYGDGVSCSSMYIGCFQSGFHIPNTGNAKDSTAFIDPVTNTQGYLFITLQRDWTTLKSSAKVENVLIKYLKQDWNETLKQFVPPVDSNTDLPVRLCTEGDLTGNDLLTDNSTVYAPGRCLVNPCVDTRKKIAGVTTGGFECVMKARDNGVGIWR